jgi:hypothetical protein
MKVALKRLVRPFVVHQPGRRDRRFVTRKEANAYAKRVTTIYTIGDVYVEKTRPNAPAGGAAQDKTCPDGTSYRRCIAWRVHGGCSYACFDMCSPEQRAACKEQHTQDKANATLTGPKQPGKGSP